MFRFTNIPQFMSVFTNSIAIAISFIIGFAYTNTKKNEDIKNNKDDKDDKHPTLKWYDYIIAFFLSVMGGFISYYVVYTFTGYLPMSRHNKV